MDRIRNKAIRQALKGTEIRKVLGTKAKYGHVKRRDETMEGSE